MRYSSLSLLLLFLFINSFVKAQDGVYTQHNNIGRTGWYNRETVLNTKNVKPGSFGKLFTRVVDDQLYAQPLVMLHVNMPGIGYKNIVYAATTNNSIYAFDADSANVINSYWHINLTQPNARPPKNADMTGACGGAYFDFNGNIGIVGTPVIDSSANTLYVVARSVDNANNFQQYLHAIDVTTGNERPNSPQQITAQVAGTGDGNTNGTVYFDPQKQNQRSGLLLLNGVVYITYASHCDWGPYHGWILGYDKTTLQQVRVYNSTPNGYFGGIWMSGSGPAADENGNIYVGVGNGSVGYNGDVANPVNRSESALKLTPSGNTFTLQSFFSPMNINDLEAGDLDFGVSQMLLVPGTNRTITSVKDGHLYLLNRDTMGGFNASMNNVVQTIDLGVNAHLRSSLTYYKGSQKEFVYSWSENALLKAFPYNRTSGQFDLNNTISSGVQGPVGNNGAVLSVSSNGSADSTAILWASYAANGDANQSVRPGVLHAFDANDVTKELWNSNIYQTDNIGNYAKFSSPTIINGKVYMGTFSKSLVVYGLTADVIDTCVTPDIALNKPTVASSSQDAQSAAANAFDGDTTTAWTSQNNSPQNIYVDLGKRYDVCSVILNWGANPAQAFQVQLSDDAINWNTYITITSNTALQNYLPVKASGRYVRMYGTSGSVAANVFSLKEMQVHGAESLYTCGPPSGLAVTNIYENSATLKWQGIATDSFHLQYKTVSAGNWTTMVVVKDTITLTGLACGTDYLFQVQQNCSDTGTSSYSAPAAFSTLSCDANCSPLPTRWTTQDIGNVGIAGSACYSNGTFTLHGSGEDIWDVADEFQYAYTTNVGDVEIQARVASMDQTNQWNKCGIMIRESLTPGSRHALIAITSGNGAAFQTRLTTDGTSNNTNTGAGITASYWIKLTKKGSVYTAFTSPDGTTFTQLGDPVDAGFGADSIPVYAGLTLTSHDNNVLSTATVDNYQLTSGSQPVQVVNFTATLSLNQSVNLEWETTLESSIQSFIIERSSDNVTFADLATVATTASPGIAEDYNYEDKQPVQGMNYYRLRIIHTDGTVSYSAVASVIFNGNTSPLIGPNPASKIVTIIQGKEMVKFVRLYDISGRLVYRLTNIIASGKINIPVYNLSNSVYVMEMRTATTVYRKKLLVHN